MHRKTPWPVNGPLRDALFRFLYGESAAGYEAEAIDVEPIISSKAEKLRGERNPRAKLSDDQVREVVRLYREGLTQREIASRYQCSRQNISSILRGRTRR